MLRSLNVACLFSYFLYFTKKSYRTILSRSFLFENNFLNQAVQLVESTNLCQIDTHRDKVDDISRSMKNSLSLLEKENNF